MLMPGRQFSGSDYCYGYNGGENLSEIYSYGNYVDLGERGVDTRLGRLNWSVDPRATEYPWQSPYAYFSNSPIVQVDYNGEGDYYGDDGKHLGSDNKTVEKDGKQVPDDKVYTSDGMNKDGSFSNAVDLNITHTDFLKKSATVYGESSRTNNEEAYAIASVHGNYPNKAAYGANNSGAKAYMNTEIDKRNGTFMQVANAAVINAVSGGFDYSYGADAWDGGEQGLMSGQECKDYVFGKSYESHAATIGWKINDALYSKWKKNVEAKYGAGSFKAPQENRAWNYKGYKNNNLMRYNATAVHGRTIFWKTVKGK